MKEKRRLCAIMFIDIVGYTRLMGEDQDLAMRAVRTLRKALTQAASVYEGELVKELGDGALVVFQTSADAASCALTLQNALQDEPFKVRIGLHLGDVVMSHKDVHGDGVNIASRIESLASPGSIFVSEAIKSAVSGQTNFTLTDKGAQSLKNVTHPVQVYELSGEPHSAEVRPRNNRRWLVGAGALLVTASLIWFVAFIFWVQPETFQSGTESSTPAEAQAQEGALPDSLKEQDYQTIAVLPFQNQGETDDGNYFSDGISEEIIFILSRLSGLRVSARSSSFHFRDSDISPSSIAEQLGVRYLLSGTVRRAGDRLRIGTELLDTTTGELVWTERFDRSLSADAIFDIQEGIAEAVSEQLPEIIGLPTYTAEQERGTESIAAYEAYLRARETSIATLDGYEERLRWLNIALDLDPTFIDAEVTKLNLRSLGVGRGFEPFDEQLPLLTEAVEDLFNRGLGERVDVLRTAGYVAYLNGEIEAAEQFYLKGMEIDPSNVNIMHSLLILTDLTGRNDESHALAEQILERDPIQGLSNFNLSFKASYAGEFEAAYIHCEDEKSENLIAYGVCKVNYYAFIAYQFGEAMGSLSEIVNDSPHTHNYFNLATLLNYLHETEHAEQWWALIEEPYYRLAMAGTSQWIDGDVEQALMSFDEAWETGRQQTALTPYAQVLLASGQYEEVLELVSHLSSLSAPDAHIDRTQMQAVLAKAYSLQQLGRNEEANALLERLLERSERDDIVHRGIYGVMYTRAEILAVMGRHEEAIEEVLALQDELPITMQHSTVFSYTPRRNPYFKALYGDPRFERWLDYIDAERSARAELSAEYFAVPEGVGIRAVQ